MIHSDAYPHLFSPFQLAGKSLRNRIVHASISTSLAHEGRITDKMLQYYANRARGGAAMIVTEPLGCAPHQPSALRICAWNDSAVDDLTRWAHAVEQHGCRIIGQLQDAGRGRHVPGRNPDAIGASALPDDLSWTVPHVLSAEEIQVLIGNFAQSAARLKRCGFSGVELSAGHGHLFHQFMSPWSNTRTDAYGRDFEGRLRFMVELIDAIREHCGHDFILGLKLPGDDGVPHSIDPALAGAIARRLTAGGQADYVCFAQGSHHRSLELHIPNDTFPRVTFRSLIRELRESIPSVPLMALGRITDPAEAESLVAGGEAELVALGRPLIADPAWPMKAAAGRARDIRYCVSGNTCWNTVISHRPIACDNNPRVAMPDELEPRTQPIVFHKRVVVIGAGVAGLEAACAAAERGHAVTVVGKSAHVGGKTRLHALLPGSESLSSIYDYQFAAAQKQGVRFELGVPATLPDILTLRPDHVVLATGATMTWPRCLPPQLHGEGVIPDLREAVAPLVGRKQRQRGTAVIFDMDHMEGTYAAAALLRTLFDKVVLITLRESVAMDTALVTRQGVLRRFHQQGIEIKTLSEPQWTPDFEEAARLAYVNIYTGAVGTIDDVAFFAYSTPRQPDDALAAPLRAAGIVPVLVGDCRVARGVLAATAEGHAAGLAIGAMQA